jgi:hypothetical protein
LTAANARISALEVELNAAREAWEGANAVKVAAEKIAKSTETKAKKAEKALSDADQKRVQRERAIAERLDKILVLVGSKCCVVPVGSLPRFLLLTFGLLSLACFSVVQQRKLVYLGNFGSQILKTVCWLRVDLLESNWKLVQKVLQLTCRVLMWIFVGLWLKKKEEMPVDNLKNLAKAFDTLEDPVLAMKGRSVKQGIEGVIVRCSTQLGTPRGRYDEHISKFPSVVKPRFIEPVGESQTSEGDAC